MPSSKGFADFILTQLSPLSQVLCRPMMGEFLLYYRDRLVGGIYDDRLLIKPVERAQTLLPEAPLLSPYPGAKPLLLAEDTDDADFLCFLITSIYPQLPLSGSTAR